MARTSNTNARVRVTADTRQAQAQMSRFRRGMQNTAFGVFNDWKRMALGIGGVATALRGASTVLRDFEAVNTNLIRATGARGQGLANLFDVTGQVAGRVGLGLDTISRLVGELDTAFPEIRQMSKETFAAVAEDVAQLQFVESSIDVERLLVAFRGFTEDVPELREAINLLSFRARGTPGGLGPVTSFLERYGNRLEAFNFDLGESIFLLTELRKQNVNLRTFGSALTRIRQESIEEGFDPRQRLFEIIDLIRTTTDEVQKQAIAFEYFGVEGSAQFLSAIDAGVFSLEGFDQALAESENALDDYEQRMTTFSSLATQVWSSFSIEIGKALQSVTETLHDAGIDIDNLATQVGRGAAGGLFRVLPGFGQAGIGRSIGQSVGERGLLQSALRQIPGALPAYNLIVNVNADTVIGGEDVGAEIAREIDRNSARSGVPPI